MYQYVMENLTIFKPKAERLSLPTTLLSFSYKCFDDSTCTAISGGHRSPSDPSMDTRHIWLSRGIATEDIRVMDPDTMVEVPPDGVTLGEVMIRGNVVMKGYLGNEDATKEAFKNGWFHSGDLGVSHGHGRFELKDRSKDIIISGGENISSIEVENALLCHPDVEDVAVVAALDEKWGEVPCAFVVLKKQVKTDHESTGEPWPQDEVTEVSLIRWSRGKLAGFKTPKKIVFVDSLPKTVTGKLQKHLLRKMLKSS